MSSDRKGMLLCYVSPIKNICVRFLLFSEFGISLTRHDISCCLSVLISGRRKVLMSLSLSHPTCHICTPLHYLLVCLLSIFSLFSLKEKVHVTFSQLHSSRVALFFTVYSGMNALCNVLHPKRMHFIAYSAFFAFSFLNFGISLFLPSSLPLSHSPSSPETPFNFGHV